jgi:hypothetical protein
MFTPELPMKLWNVLGPDALRLSQPTHYWSGGRVYFLPLKGPCVARCQYAFQISASDSADLSHPILCGALAMLLPDGSYRCVFHTDADLGCAWCEEYTARGEDRACPGCHATWKQKGWACFCCPDVMPDGTYDADTDYDVDV